MGAAIRDTGLGIDHNGVKPHRYHTVDIRVDDERAKILNDLVFAGGARAYSLAARPGMPKQNKTSAGNPPRHRASRKIAETMDKTVRYLVLSWALLLLQASVCYGQRVPSGGPDDARQPINIMAPAAPGGGWDQTARALQAALSASLGQKAQVYNVTGAGGVVGLAQFISVLGFLLRRYDFPVGPTVLGVILMPQAEAHFRRALTISQGDWSVFVTRPLSLVILLLAAALLILPFALKFAAKRRGK